MSYTPAITDPTTWALDREIVFVRVLDATREAVFAAWTDADAFCQWFGPDGFTCTVREMDVRPGGRACFDMVSRDGTVFTNRFEPRSHAHAGTIADHAPPQSRRDHAGSSAPKRSSELCADRELERHQRRRHPRAVPDPAHRILVDLPTGADEQRARTDEPEHPRLGRLYDTPHHERPGLRRVGYQRCRRHDGPSDTRRQLGTRSVEAINVRVDRQLGTNGSATEGLASL